MNSDVDGLFNLPRLNHVPFVYDIRGQADIRGACTGFLTVSSQPGSFVADQGVAKQHLTDELQDADWSSFGTSTRGRSFEST